MDFRPFSRRLLTLAGVATLLSITALAPAQTVDGKPEVKARVLDRISAILSRSAFVPGVDFNKWSEFLAQNREAIDKAKDDTEFQMAVNTALSDFGTSHCVLATPRQSEQRRTSSTVGIGISSQTTKDGLVIIRVVKGGAAEAAGIIPGDTITKVEGQPVEGIKGIPGDEGTVVHLTVLHADGKTQEYALTRKKFSTVREEELVWDDKDTARLIVYTFDYSYNRANVEKLMTDAKKAKNLILDLRDNGGGAVLNLQHLLGLLMNPEQPIGTFISRSMVERYKSETGADGTNLEAIAQWSSDKIRPQHNARMSPYIGNLMVFVNGNSGSASEIAAAALQENAGAKVIGTKSAGAVLVSVIVPASDGFMLQYPMSDYLTARGKRLEGNGVTPDIVAEDPLIKLQTAKDACVEAALRLVAQHASGSGNG